MGIVTCGGRVGIVTCSGRVRIVTCDWMGGNCHLWWERWEL